MLQKTYDVIKEFQAHEGVKIQQLTTGLIEKRLGLPELAIDFYDSPIQADLKHAYQNKLNLINKRLQAIEIFAQLDTYKETIGKFRDYGFIDNVFDQGKTQLAHKPGEVLLIDVWATWCGPCQKPMKHNQEMLEKNAGIWGDKVRIIGVSVDESKEVIRQRVTSKKWQKVAHFTLLGWNHNHGLIKDFNIQGIPFVCLVDKWGNINHTGHPSSIDLQARINELLSQQEEALPKVATATSVDNSEIIQKVLTLLTKESVQKEFKDVEFVCLKYQKKYTIQNGVKGTYLTIEAYYADGDHIAEDMTKKLFGDHPGVELKINKINYTPIPHVQNPQCSLCHVKNINYPFYWLRWEEGTQFGCRNCVQKKSTIAGHHHAYEKNAVLMLGKWQKVAQKDLGKNIQPQNPSKVQNEHEYGCNGCGQGSSGIEHPRYICLGCRTQPRFTDGGFVDLCQKCMDKVAKNDAEVINQLTPDGHQKNHPFLRILYNVKGYYDF